MDERADHRRWVERVTDRDVTHLLGEALDELVIDRILHEHTTRTGAALAVEAVDHEDDGVQCSVAIGVVEDDHRVLAAELEVHPLQRRRALCLDHRTGRRLADECDRLDQRVLGERRAGGLAHSVHDVEHPRRQTRLERDLRQELCGVGRPFGRLVHHRATGGKRRGNLPGAQHERCIPRCDHADGADRMASRVVDMIGRRERQPVGSTRRPIGEETEVVGSSQRSGRHEPHGLAGVDAFGDGNLVTAFDDEVGHGVQDRLALGAGAAAPVEERVVRCLRCGVDIGCVASGDVAERPAVDRRVVRERLARSARHPLPPDQVRQRRVGIASHRRLGEGEVLFVRGGGARHQ